MTFVRSDLKLARVAVDSMGVQRRVGEARVVLRRERRGALIAATVGAAFAVISVVWLHFPRGAVPLCIAIVWIGATSAPLRRLRNRPDAELVDAAETNRSADVERPLKMVALALIVAMVAIAAIVCTVIALHT